MFFGLELKSNQPRTIKLDYTLRLSQAVLEPTKSGKRDPVSLVAEYKKKQFILCVLDPTLSWQCPLDLCFEAGSSIKFFLRGQGNVHLTGYENFDDLDIDDLSMSMSDEEDSEPENNPRAVGSIPVKRAPRTPNGNSTKKLKTDSARKSKSPKAIQNEKNDSEAMDDEQIETDSSDEDFLFQENSDFDSDGDGSDSGDLDELGSGDPEDGDLSYDSDEDDDDDENVNQDDDDDDDDDEDEDEDEDIGEDEDIDDDDDDDLDVD